MGQATCFTVSHMKTNLAFVIMKVELRPSDFQISMIYLFAQKSTFLSQLRSVRIKVLLLMVNFSVRHYTNTKTKHDHLLVKETQSECYNRFFAIGQVILKDKERKRKGNKNEMLLWPSRYFTTLVCQSSSSSTDHSSGKPAVMKPHSPERCMSLEPIKSYASAMWQWHMFYPPWETILITVKEVAHSWCRHSAARTVASHELH